MQCWALRVALWQPVYGPELQKMGAHKLKTQGIVLVQMVRRACTLWGLLQGLMQRVVALHEDCWCSCSDTTLCSGSCTIWLG
jgi:hypothetical protein